MPNKKKKKKIFLYYTYTMGNSLNTYIYIIFKGKKLMQWLESSL